MNAKLPAASRGERVVAENSAAEIVWVEGLRLGERVRVAQTQPGPGMAMEAGDAVGQTTPASRGDGGEPGKGGARNQPHR